jgi:hypothetical protein
MDMHTLTALSSLLSILGIAYLILWRYRVLCMDMFRQTMFELRDELFDYALEGHIDFSDPAYGVLRNTLNGYIRFAHKTTTWHGIILALLWPRDDKRRLKDNGLSFRAVWQRATGALTPDVKEHLERLRMRIHRAAFFYFIVSCPELFLLFLPFLLLLGLLLGLLITLSKIVTSKLVSDGINFIQQMKRRWSESDNVALLYGENPI